MQRLNLFNADVREKIDNKPLVIRYVASMLHDCINSIVNDKCDEEELLCAVASIKNNCESRYCNEDLMNYDEAGKALGFGTTNRVGLKKLLDKHGIKEVIINNMKCGFPRKAIMTLRDKVQMEQKQKRH